MGYGIEWTAYVSLAAAMFIELSGGHVYLFGKYSDELKVTLFNDTSAQTKIQSMALAANIGNYLPIAGPFYDSRYGGPTRTVLLGMMITFPGYFLLYLAANQTVGLPYTVLLIACAMWGNGSSYYNTGAIATCLRNFPHHRGVVVGLLSSFFGLSASVMVQWFYAWFRPASAKGKDAGDEKGAPEFLLFLAIQAVAIPAVAILFLSRSDPVSAGCGVASRRFRAAQAVVAAVAIGMMSVAIYSAALDNGASDAFDNAAAATALAALLLLLFLPCGAGPLRPRAGYDAAPSAPAAAAAAVTAKAAAAGEGGDVDDGGGAWAAAPRRRNTDVTAASGRTSRRSRPVSVAVSVAAAPGPRAGPELRTAEAMRTPEFWLLFACLVPACGGGLTVINNIAQMTKARGDEGLTDVIIQLISVFNCFSRMLTGWASDAWAARVPRPWFLTGILAVMLLAHGLLALPIDSAAVLIPCGCLAGFAYGAVWAIFPSMLSEFFGLGSFASLFTWCVLSATVGSLVFSTVLATAVYESHQDDSGDCFGTRCYAVTHIGIVCCCGAALLLSMYLSRRVRHLYRPGSVLVDVALLDESAGDEYPSAVTSPEARRGGGGIDLPRLRGGEDEAGGERRPLSAPPGDVKP